MATLAALALAALGISSAPPGEDLAKVYPATREWVQSGLAAVCEPQDVWALRSFELDAGKELRVACKAAQVAFGRDGTDVLWALVLPEEPPKLEGTLAPEGETARTILLRFAPSQVGALFPARTVVGAGDPWLRAKALRVARRKMVWKWCTPAGNSTIVPRSVTIVDVDTVEGPRRFWARDRDAGSVVRVEDFTDQATPAERPIAPKDAEAAFEQVWEAFDREYPGFVELPELDWAKTGKRYRALAREARTTFELAAVLADMLAGLQDLHVFVRDGQDWLPGYTRERALNGSWQATRAALQGVHEAGKNLVWGRIEGELGYLGVHGLSDPELPRHFDAALEALKDTRGLVVDLRFNGGGDELLGRALAGRFLAEPRVYSKNRYRSGPKHDQLGPVHERVVEPRGPWRYESPVVCLIGRRTMSSAESTALMLAQCPDVTTLGSPTAGSSANPRLLELDCGVAVNLPRWLDLLPDGTPLERRGAPPDVLSEHPPAAFTGDADPVLAAAVARLRR